MKLIIILIFVVVLFFEIYKVFKIEYFIELWEIGDL